MLRITKRQAVALAGCAAIGLLPFLAELRHAGYWVALGALGAGLAVGLRAVVLVFLMSGLIAVGWAVGTSSPPNGDSDLGAIALFLTIIPAMFAVPAILGAAVRAVVQRRRGHRAMVPLTAVEAGITWLMLAVVALATALVFGIGPFAVAAVLGLSALALWGATRLTRPDANTNLPNG